MSFPEYLPEPLVLKPGHSLPEPQERIVVEIDLTALIQQLVELHEELRELRRERAERLFRRED